MSFDVPMFALISCSIDFTDFWWPCSWIVDILYRSSSKTIEGGRCIHLCLLAATGSKCWSKCEFAPHGFQHELFVKRISLKFHNYIHCFRTTKKWRYIILLMRYVHRQASPYFSQCNMPLFRPKQNPSNSMRFFPLRLVQTRQLTRMVPLTSRQHDVS